MIRFKDGISPLRGWTILVGTFVGGLMVSHFASEMVPVLFLVGPIAWFVATDYTPRKPLWKMFRKDEV